MTGITQSTPSYHTQEQWEISSTVCCRLPWKAPSFTLLYLREEKSHAQFCTFDIKDRCSSRAALWQRWFTSAWSFCGKVAAGPQKRWPVPRSEAGWRDDSRLSLLVSEPSSQEWCTIVTWKNVGCRCWVSDQHADEETFHFRARDPAISGVTDVHAYARWWITNIKD